MLAEVPTFRIGTAGAVRGQGGRNPLGTLSNPGAEINRFRQLLVFDRFLARIFRHFAGFQPPQPLTYRILRILHPN